MYNDPTCKPWTSRTWAPAGYSSRYDLVEQTKAAQARKPLASGALEEKHIEHAEGGRTTDEQYSKHGDIGAGQGGVPAVNGPSVAEAGFGLGDVKTVPDQQAITSP